jgi:hypothetical protein
MGRKVKNSGPSKIPPCGEGPGFGLSLEGLLGRGDKQFELVEETLSRPFGKITQHLISDEPSLFGNSKYRHVIKHFQPNISDVK